MVKVLQNRSLRCQRCGGRMLTSEDGFSCLLCGHAYYGPGFEPLTLTVADAKRFLNSNTEPEKAPASPFRRHDGDGWPY